MKTIIILFFVLIVGGISFSIMSYFHTSTITVKVTDKERIVDTNGKKSFYLIYTERGALKLEDDILRGNWNSSDIYGSIKQDSIYTFTTSGYRIGFFSMYPNIIQIK